MTDSQDGVPARLMHIFDQVLDCIAGDQVETAITILAGALLTVENVAVAHALLRSHPLHVVLLEDPYTAQAYHKPRGYAGDALVMDMIYDQIVPNGVTERGRDLFAVTTAFPVAQAVRSRRKLAAELVERASADGQRICSLACGHLRELDTLTARNLSRFIAVEQDPMSVEFVRHRHRSEIDVRVMNVFAYLRQAVSAGDKFDLIYSLGFTDYCDPRAMALLHRLMVRCLSDDGTILVANFTPRHLAQGWLEVCLDWHLTYRDEVAMLRHAADAGLAAELWRDETRSVLYSRMTRAG